MQAWGPVERPPQRVWHLCSDAWWTGGRTQLEWLLGTPNSPSHPARTPPPSAPPSPLVKAVCQQAVSPLHALPPPPRSPSEPSARSSPQQQILPNASPPSMPLLPPAASPPFMQSLLLHPNASPPSMQSLQHPASSPSLQPPDSPSMSPLRHASAVLRTPAATPLPVATPEASPAPSPPVFDPSRAVVGVSAEDEPPLQRWVAAHPLEAHALRRCVRRWRAPLLYVAFAAWVSGSESGFLVLLSVQCWNNVSCAGALYTLSVSVTRTAFRQVSAPSPAAQRWVHQRTADTHRAATLVSAALLAWRLAAALSCERADRSRRSGARRRLRRCMREWAAAATARREATARDFARVVWMRERVTLRVGRELLWAWSWAVTLTKRLAAAQHWYRPSPPGPLSCPTRDPHS